MFCFKCGEQIPDNSKFCMKCGTEIAIVSEAVSEPAPSVQIPDFYKKINIGHGYLITVTQDAFECKYLTTTKFPIQGITQFAIRYGSVIDDGKITVAAGSQKMVIPLRKKFNDDLDEIQRFLLTVNPAISTDETDSYRTTGQPSAPKQPPIAQCPKCKSTSLSADKKGFGVGKAVIGGWLLGPIGLVGGNIGKDKVIVTCLNCGHQFKPHR